MSHILILLGVLRLLSIRLQKVTTIKWAFFIHIFFFINVTFVMCNRPQASCSCKKKQQQQQQKQKEKTI